MKRATKLILWMSIPYCSNSFNMFQYTMQKQHITTPNSHLLTQKAIFTKLTTMNPNASNTKIHSLTSLKQSSKSNDDFSFAQRIESLKTLVVGALAGGIALTPFSALHDIFLDGDYVRNGVAQWEFDTDMGSIECGLFAIVYRYCVRQDDNPMLKQGVIGAFAIVRILSKIQVPVYCSAAPLTCGEPLGYFDWEMLSQAGLSGVESAAMFGAAAAAMEYCFYRKIISKFRN